MKNRFSLALICIVLCLTCACTLPRTMRTPINHYTLEYESPKINGLSPLDTVVRVQRFSVAPDANFMPIVYRDGEHKRNTYAYHKWRANPGDLATYYLVRDMRNAGLFSAVLSYDSNLRATHTLEGTVDEFFEKDSETGWEAVLSVSIVMVKDREPDIAKRVLLQKQYSFTCHADQNTPEGIAKAMSKAMAQTSSALIKDVHKALSDNETDKKE